MLAKPVILTLVNHYLPGFHYGGPIRSIANLVEWLGDDFNFLILTKDRDLNSDIPYPNLSSGKWYSIGKAQVRYLTPQEQQLPNLVRVYHQVDFDLLYLNVVFSALTIETLVLSRMGLLPNKPILLASRGTLNSAALNLKSRKKTLFLDLARQIGLYKNLNWHATSSEEVTEIEQTFGSKSANQIHCIENLPSPTTQLDAKPLINKTAGIVRIVYLSRIDPKKNLHFALESLENIIGGIVFDIYGPVKDIAYWAKCKTLIDRLPPHVKVAYKGPVSADSVSRVLKEYNLFFLPTLNENFGHAIFEALCAGCPILISDRTPWDDAAKQGAGWSLPLEKAELFTQALQEMVEMDMDEFTKRSKAAIDFGQHYLETTPSIRGMKELLYKVIQG